MRESDYFVHSLALCEAEIGRGSRIWAWAHVMKAARIGKNCNICDHCFVESGAEIGDDCVIKNGVSIWDGVVLKEKVFVGPNVSFTNDLVPRVKALVPHFKKADTLVGVGVSIGANSTIRCGIEIGDYCLIGAGSVVTKSFPAFSMVYGNPAKHRGWVSVEGDRLEFKSDGEVIVANGASYRLLDGRVQVVK